MVDLGNMMKQAQQLQKKMSEAQEKLNSIEVEGVSGGGMVKVVATAKGEVKRYEMDNLYALNFILGDSLGGGGSESLLNDAQGKTHGQALLLMEVELPDTLSDKVRS